MERVRKQVSELETVTATLAKWGINAIYNENKISGTLKGLYPEYQENRRTEHRIRTVHQRHRHTRPAESLRDWKAYLRNLVSGRGRPLRKVH